MQVRICPECGEEYRPEIVLCADCGALLQDADGERGAPQRPAAEPSEPAEPEVPEGYQPVFWSSQPREIRRLAERLDKEGIPLHLQAQATDRQRSSLRLALLVPEDQRARALEILGPYLDADADPALLQAVEREFDPSEGYLRCPACGGDLGPGAFDCPACGLTVGESEPACPRCGGPLPGEGEACPACGA
jgi:hypothetical protein